MARFIGTLVLVASAFATTARASTYDFDFSFLADAGTGTLTATYDSVENDYLVTAITGTTSAFGSITGLLPVNTLGGNDNVLFLPDAPYLDVFGIAFTVAGGGDDGLGNVNVYYDDSSGAYTEDSEFAGFGTFTVTPVSDTPEPAPTTLLLLASLAAAAGVCWIRTRPFSELLNVR